MSTSETRKWRLKYILWPNPSSSEVKNEWSLPPLPRVSCLCVLGEETVFLPDVGDHQQVRAVSYDPNICVGVDSSWQAQTMATHLARDLRTEKLTPKQLFLLNLDGAFPFPHSCAIVTLQFYQ